MNEEKPSKGNEKDYSYLRFLGVASTVGVNFVATTLVGFAIGHWVLDAYFDTSPWFAIIFMLLGIAAGFKYLFKLLRRSEQFNSEEDNERDEG